MSAVRNEGLCASYSFPLHVGAARLGVLDLYGERVHSLEPDQTSMAFIFAEVATERLLEPGSGSGWLLDDRTVASVERRAEIHQAQGMVTVDLGLDLAEALALMRAHAFSRDLPLLQIAQGIISGERLIVLGDA